MAAMQLHTSKIHVLELIEKTCLHLNILYFEENSQTLITVEAWE